jgi:aminopeptidase N
MSLPPPLPPSPTARLASLADSIGGAFEYMRGEYGPPPIKWLTVSPIPGAFGQGFPGLVYLSTLAYLRPEERPASLRSRSDEVFFGELLGAHEVAHQWWGNSVAAARYEDDWLMEALASYASLQYLEKRRGSRALESILNEYQEHLLRKGEDGRTVESVGPVIWGLRLQSSQSEVAWRTIVYEKGAWIMHMLRRRMGDQKFTALLAEMNKRYAREVIGTEQFRMLAEEVMGARAGSNALGEFFETWVYGTGIPTLQLTWSAKGKAPSVRITGTIVQSGVDEEFGAEVPVEIHFPGRPPVTQWVRTSAEPATFTITAKQPPARVVLPAGTGILAIRK